MNTMQNNAKRPPARKPRVLVEWFVDPLSAVEVRMTRFQGQVVNTGTRTRTMPGLASDSNCGYLGCDAAQDHTRPDAPADY